jgi:thiol-disulfide isomerase/thioredoxin
MRSAGAGLIVAALLALAGCRSTDPKGPDKTPGAAPAGRRTTRRARGKGQTWLDDVNRLPGADTAIPKGVAPTNPKDPLFDTKTAAGNALSGRVVDPYGRPARNVFVRVEPLGGAGAPGELGIHTDNNGYFQASGLKPGISYEVSVSAASDGKTYTGSVQTKVPAAGLTLHLRDDLPPRAGPGPKPGVLPPAAPPKPPADAWVPNAPTNSGVPPATIGGTPPAASGSGALPGRVPEPDNLDPSGEPRPVKPENVADGPKNPWKPPAVSVPNPNGPPPVPPLPKLPPTFNPSSGGGRSAAGNGRPVGKFTLLDAQERPWESTHVPPGGLVLVEFVTSSCEHSKRAVPVLKDLQSRYGAAGLQVIGVLCDDLSQKERAAAAAQLHREQNLNYALYVEPVKAGSVRDRFEVEAYPHVLLLDAGGRTVWRGNPLDREKLEAAVKQGLGK